MSNCKDCDESSCQCKNPGFENTGVYICLDCGSKWSEYELVEVDFCQKCRQKIRRDWENCPGNCIDSKYTRKELYSQGCHSCLSNRVYLIMNAKGDKK